MNHHDPTLASPPGAGPGRPAGVAACEPAGWATLISRPAYRPGHATARDPHRHLPGRPGLPGLLDCIAGRIHRQPGPDRALDADRRPR